MSSQSDSKTAFDEGSKIYHMICKQVFSDDMIGNAGTCISLLFPLTKFMNSNRVKSMVMVSHSMRLLGVEKSKIDKLYRKWLEVLSENESKNELLFSWAMHSYYRGLYEDCLSKLEPLTLYEHSYQCTSLVYKGISIQGLKLRGRQTRELADICFTKAFEIAKGGSYDSDDPYGVLYHWANNTSNFSTEDSIRMMKESIELSVECLNKEYEPSVDNLKKYEGAMNSSDKPTPPQTIELLKVTGAGMYDCHANRGTNWCLEFTEKSTEQVSITRRGCQVDFHRNGTFVYEGKIEVLGGDIHQLSLHLKKSDEKSITLKPEYFYIEEIEPEEVEGEEGEGECGYRYYVNFRYVFDAKNKDYLRMTYTVPHVAGHPIRDMMK